MIIFHTITIDLEAMAQAHEAVTRAGRTWKNLNAEIEALPRVSLEANGTMGVAKRRETLEHYKELKNDATVKALEAIQAAKDRFNAHIDAQVQLSGDYLEAGKSTVDLLTGPFVESAEQLQQIMSTGDNMANPCIRRAANLCAQRLGADFSYADRSTLARLFSADFFDICSRAAKNPADGYAVMLLETESMQADLVRIHNISEEYEASKAVQA